MCPGPRSCEHAGKRERHSAPCLTTVCETALKCPADNVANCSPANSMKQGVCGAFASAGSHSPVLSDLMNRP
jgi:hypothetical protein